MALERIRPKVTESLEELTHANISPVRLGAKAALRALKREQLGIYVVEPTKARSPITDFNFTFLMNAPLTENQPVIVVSKQLIQHTTQDDLTGDLARTVALIRQYPLGGNFHFRGYEQRYTEIYTHAIVSQMLYLQDEGRLSQRNDPRILNHDVLLGRLLHPSQSVGDVGIGDWRVAAAQLADRKSNPQSQDQIKRMGDSESLFVNIRTRLGNYVHQFLTRESPETYNGLDQNDRSGLTARIMLGLYLHTDHSKN